MVVNVRRSSHATSIAGEIRFRALVQKESCPGHSPRISWLSTALEAALEIHGTVRC